MYQIQCIKILDNPVDADCHKWDSAYPKGCRISRHMSPTNNLEGALYELGRLNGSNTDSGKTYQLVIEPDNIIPQDNKQQG